MNLKSYLTTATFSLMIAGAVDGYAQSSTSPANPAPTYYNPVLVDGVSLAVTHDARAAALGGAGITTSPDGMSLMHNLSKLGFIDQEWGISANYVPWMSEMVKDMSFSSLVGYYTFQTLGGIQHGLSASLRYFNIGSVKAFAKGKYSTDIHPYEFSVDLGYALKFHPQLSTALAMRYLISDYNYTNNDVSSKAQALLFDWSMTYFSALDLFGKTGSITAALAVNNMGGKVSHDGGKSYLFLPAVLRLGVGMTSDITPLSNLGLFLEVDKQLAPTMPSSLDPNYTQQLEAYYAQNPFKALFTSWGDAPSGFKEELSEVGLSIGAEYSYMGRLFGRIGYRYSHPSKATDQGISFGVGMVYNVVRIDAAYTISTVPESPLNNLFRFSLGIDF